MRYIPSYHKPAATYVVREVIVVHTAELDVRRGLGVLEGQLRRSVEGVDDVSGALVVAGSSEAVWRCNQAASYGASILDEAYPSRRFARRA